VKVNTPVMIRGGRMNDVPGVRYKIMKGKLGVSKLENFVRVKRRSKYNLKKEDIPQIRLMLERERNKK